MFNQEELTNVAFVDDCVGDAPYPNPSIILPKIRQKAGIAAPKPDAAIIPIINKMQSLKAQTDLNHI